MKECFYCWFYTRIRVAMDWLGKGHRCPVCHGEVPRDRGEVVSPSPGEVDGSTGGS